jgi:nitric oxide dioxygenase
VTFERSLAVLAPQTIAVIKATVPVLVEHGETLTRHFYRRMFEGNPEVRAFFNPAHQHSGGQQRALAAAICAYAQNIENPAVLAGAVELIAQKHCSLGVKPEHYPIVGEHLLGSIREVLGAACTGEIIDAWAAAYGLLADILIAREAEIYRSHEAEHGWQGFGRFFVQRKQRESDVITSFYLSPVARDAVRPFKAGQYVTVRVPTKPNCKCGTCGKDGPATTMRNYSLSCAPGSPHYRISVKREDGAPAGYVSSFLHQHVKVGDTIEVGPPCGEFTLAEDRDDRRPLVLVSGGVGITPVLSMLHAALARDFGRDILFVHGAIDGGRHAFRREVLDLADGDPRLRVHFRYSNPTRLDREAELFDSVGNVGVKLIESLLEGPDAAFYFCGPKPFMAGLQRGLLGWGVRPDDLHSEFFGPKQSLDAAAAEEAVAV